MNLKPFAADPNKSLGRQFKEPSQNFEMISKRPRSYYPFGRF